MGTWEDVRLPWAQETPPPSARVPGGPGAQMEVWLGDRG